MAVQLKLGIVAFDWHLICFEGSSMSYDRQMRHRHGNPDEDAHGHG